MDYVQTCHQVHDFIGRKQNEYIMYTQQMINTGHVLVPVVLNHICRVISITVAQAPVDNPEKLHK